MYRRNRHRWTKHLDFILLDLLCMNIAYDLAYVLRHGVRSNPYESDIYLRMLLFMCFGNVIVAIGAGTYKNVLKRGYMDEAIASLRQVLSVVLLTSGYLFAVKEGDIASRFVLLFSGALYLVMAYLFKVLWKLFLLKRMEKNMSSPLLIVTISSRAEEIVRQMQLRGYNQYHIVGLVLLDNPDTEQEYSGVKVVATRENAAEYVCREWIDEVLVDMLHMEESPQDLLEKFMEMGVVVHIVISNVFNPFGQSQLAERMCGMTVLTSSIRWVDSSQLVLKRAVDICAGLVGSIIAILFTIIFGPMIFIASPGPIFFKQIRVGKNGKKFKMYKLRSMYLDAEERKKDLLDQNNCKDGRMFKLDFDPRVIGCKMREDGTIKKGLGNVLRDWSIDEWPQWFNVLLGDMSAVGTRPPTVDEWEKYELHHRQRLAIKPGITGLWQVSGRSNILDFEEVVRLDAEYIADWSLKKDFQILLKTVKVVMGRVGAK